MLKIETPSELAARLELTHLPELLGFSLWYEKGEKAGFIHKFKFKFDTVHSDKNSFGFDVIRCPTTKTSVDSFVYDLETAVMIQSVFNWFTAVQPQIHYCYNIQEDGKQTLATTLVPNTNITKH